MLNNDLLQKPFSFELSDGEWGCLIRCPAGHGSRHDNNLTSKRTVKVFTTDFSHDDDGSAFAYVKTKYLYLVFSSLSHIFSSLTSFVIVTSRKGRPQQHEKDNHKIRRKQILRICLQVTNTRRIDK